MSTFLRTATGDLVVPRQLVTIFNAVCMQKIIDVLAMWQTEWFLDRNWGFPWFTILGQKVVSTAQATQLLKTAIGGVPGVVTVVANTSVNRAARSFSFTFAATLNSGATVSGGSGQPTVLTGGS